jgi:hypothetical protein
MTFRAPPVLTARVEAWAKRQPHRPSRSEALRQLVTLGLNFSELFGV